MLFEGPNGSGKTTTVELIVGAIDALMCPYSDLDGSSAPAWKNLQRRVSDASVARVEWSDPSFADLLVDIFPPPAREPSLADRKRFAQSPDMHGLRDALAHDDVAVRCAFFTYHGHVNTPNMYSEGPRNLQSGPLAGTMTFGSQGAMSDQLGQMLTNLESERTKARAYALERPDEEALLTKRAEMLLRSQRRMEGALSRILDREIRFAFEMQRQSPRVLFDGQEVNIDLLGEGMRRTFSWLADLMSRLELIRWEDASLSPFDQEFWLFLDEVDQSLHPTMQMRLMPTLRKLFPRARIYATTHSPFVVASVEEGYVFSIRPDRKTHRVSGVIEAQHLRGGRTLESVVNDVFDAPATFIDEKTRHALQKHREQVDALRRDQPIDAHDFLANRQELHELGEEVWTVVAMREVPARKKIEEIARAAAPREAGE